MSDINLTKAVRQNLLSLQNTAKLMATTQNRLATGNKVNTALDNPTNFFTASSLNSRAGELDALLDSMNNGVKTLEAADNGLTSITKTLESMQSTLRQARQDKTFETASYSLSPANVSLTAGAAKLTLVGGAFGTSTPTIDLTTTASGQKVVSNAAYTAPAATAAKATLNSAVDLTNARAATITGNGVSTITYQGKSVSVTLSDYAANTDATDVVTTINQAIAGSDLNGKLEAKLVGGTLQLQAKDTVNSDITTTGNIANFLTGGAADVSGASGKYEFSVNGVAITLDSTTGSDVTTAVENVNSQLASAGSKFKAVIGPGSTLQIQGATTNAGALQVTGADADIFSATPDVTSVAGTTDAALVVMKTIDTLVAEINNNATTKGIIKASNDDGKLRIQNLSTQDLTVQGTDTSGKATGDSSDSSVVDGNSVRSGLADQFNVLRDQLDKMADDASFNGVNLLRGDKLKITFNETGTSSIDIQVKDGKSVDSTELGLPTTMVAKDLDTDSGIDSLLDDVKAAITQVRAQASTFGSNLSVVENRQDFTKKMMNTLQGGASNLTLADMNEEAANMVALQTRQSLATSSLSMANQADQNVLQLLR